MPDRNLIVRILGDASSLKNTFNDATRATKNFGAVQAQEAQREEQTLLRLKSKRAQSLGPLRIAAAGLAGGAGVFAAIQGLRALADGLKVSGDEAFTTTGRIRNLGAELASGNIVAGFQALAQQETRIAPDLEKAIGLLRQMREESSRISLADVVGQTDSFDRKLLDAQRDLVSIGLSVDEAKQKTAEWRTELETAAGVTFNALSTNVNAVVASVVAALGQVAAAVGAIEKKRQAVIAGLAEQPPGIGAAISREQGKGGSEEGQLKVLGQARANVLKRIEEAKKLGKTKDVSALLKTLNNELNAIDAQIAAIFQARADAAEKQRAAAEAAAAKQKAAAAAAVRAQREAFAAQLGFLDIKFDRAKITRGLQNDLDVLDEQEKAVRAQIKVEGRTVALERQLFTIEQERAAILADRKNRAKSAVQASQFKALGFTAEGEQKIPTAENLRKRVGSISKAIEGTVLDTPKTRAMLEKFRHVLAGEYGKITEETRRFINDFIRALEGDQEIKKGPLTKTSGLNTKKFLEGLGLTPEQEREARARLSGLNSAGQALAPPGTPKAVAKGPPSFVGGAVVVESFTTINLDGTQIAKVVTKNQQKTGRRNPRQKRGPNRVGGAAVSGF